MRTKVFVFLLLVTLVMAGCSNANASSKEARSFSGEAVSASETVEDISSISEGIALNHDIERVQVKLEDYIVGEDEKCRCLCLKQNDRYYALSRIEPGRRQKDFGINMYDEAFMYDESQKTFSSGNPRELVLLVEDKVILGNVPIPVVSKEDTLLVIYSLSHDSFDPGRFLRAYECQFDSYALRMTEAPDSGGWLIYDHLNDETVYLSPEEFETVELKDSQGRRHNKKYNTLRACVGFESLEYGESYQMTWKKEGEEMHLEVVADSYRFSTSGSDFNSKEYDLKLLEERYSPFYYREYQIGDLPPGLYYVTHSSATSSGFIEVR